MPVLKQDMLKGAVKLNGLADRECFTSWKDFLSRLPDLLSIEVPQGIGGVISSHQPPSEDDRDKLWVRRDTNGNFLGLYTFQDGNWQPFFDMAVGEVRWLVGDSANPPAGFVFIDEGDAVIPSNVVASLKAQYVPNSLGPGFSFYAVRFEGF